MNGFSALLTTSVVGWFHCWKMEANAPELLAIWDTMTLIRRHRNDVCKRICKIQYNMFMFVSHPFNCCDICQIQRWYPSDKRGFAILKNRVIEQKHFFKSDMISNSRNVNIDNFADWKIVDIQGFIHSCIIILKSWYRMNIFHKRILLWITILLYCVMSGTWMALLQCDFMPTLLLTHWSC